MTSPLRRIACICSSGRSGSTLFDMLLGSHARWVSLGEIDHLPKNIALDTPCSCGVPASRCTFWRSVFDELLSMGTDVRKAPYAFPIGLFRASRVIDPVHQTPLYLLKRRLVLGMKLLELRDGIRLPPRNGLYERCIDNSLTLYDAIANAASAEGIVDSSKEYRRAVSIYRRDPRRTRLLLLVRDGRAVFNAMRRSGSTPAVSLAFWKRYYEHALPVIQRNVPASDWMMVKYEDLVATPEATLESVARFLGVVFEPAMLRFRDTPKHILNGNDMRSSGGDVLQLDERWRRELNPQDLAYFVQRGGQRLNAKLGYM